MTIRKTKRKSLPEPTEKTEETIDDIDPGDPLALYKEHSFDTPPTGSFEKFRRFALTTKGAVYALLLLSIVLPMAIILKDRSPDSPEQIVRNYFGRFSSASSNSVYSIGPVHISAQHIERLHGAVVRFTIGPGGATEYMSDANNNALFARDQFETDLLVNAALTEGVLKSEDARLVIENSLRHAIADYYLYSRLSTEQSDFRIVVPREEILDMYEKNREFYSKQGLSRSESLLVIERSLYQVRRDALNLQILRARQEIIETLKDRAGYVYNGPAKQ